MRFRKRVIGAKGCTKDCTKILFQAPDVFNITDMRDMYESSVHRQSQRPAAVSEAVTATAFMKIVAGLLSAVRASLRLPRVRGNQ